MVTKMMKAKNPSPKEKPVNIVKKTSKGNPKKQKQQLKNVKKTVEAKILKVPAAKKPIVNEEDTVEETESVSGSEEINKYSLTPGNTIVVKYSKSSVTEDDLHQTFSSCGEIKTVLALKNKKSKLCLGLAYVEFKSPDAIDSALEIKCTVDDNKPVHVEQYIWGKKSIKPHHKTKNLVGNLNTTIFVKDLKHSSNKNDLKKFFSSCGKIEYINLRNGRVGKDLKARAFVCFKSADSVNLALKLNETLFDGVPIHVEEYSENPKRKTSIKKNRKGTKKVTKTKLQKKKVAQK